LHFGGFCAISQQRVYGSTPNCICVGTMSGDVPLPPLGSIGRWGRVEGKLKAQKMGVVSFVQWTATISIFLSASKCGSICRAQTCAHSGLEPSRSAKAFLQGGPKVRKNFEFFTISRFYVPISHKRLKMEGYKQRKEISFIPPLSNCRMCMDPSLTGFYRVGQKLSDVIPVLRITPRATEPSTVSVFLSVVKCSRICSAQTCAHFGIEPSRLAKGFPQGGPKSSKKIEFLTISKIYVPLYLQPL